MRQLTAAVRDFSLTAIRLQLLRHDLRTSELRIRLERTRPEERTFLGAGPLV